MHADSKEQVYLVYFIDKSKNYICTNSFFFNCVVAPNEILQTLADCAEIRICLFQTAIPAIIEAFVNVHLIVTETVHDELMREVFRTTTEVCNFPLME